MASTTIPVIQQPENYVRGVSFNTMTDQDQPDFSFTLRGKNQGYQRTRRSRTFMVATDLANYSDYALDWALEVCRPTRITTKSRETSYLFDSIEYY